MDYLFLKNPENFIIRNNEVYLVREKKITCEDCPDCDYCESPTDKKFKVRKCENH